MSEPNASEHIKHIFGEPREKQLFGIPEQLPPMANDAVHSTKAKQAQGSVHSAQEKDAPPPKEKEAPPPIPSTASPSTSG